MRKPKTYTLREATLTLQNEALRNEHRALKKHLVARIKSLELALKLAHKAHRARVTECKRLEEFARSLGGKVNYFRGRLAVQRRKQDICAEATANRGEREALERMSR